MRRKYFIPLIFLFILAYMPAHASILDSYSQDFSNFSDGITIHGKDYWKVSGGSQNNSVAQSGITPDGAGNSVKLAGLINIPTIERPYNYGSLTPTWIHFKVRPGPSAQTPNAPTTGIGAICFDYTGHILVADGNAWVASGATYTLGRWYDVTLKLNFKNHTYDLYVNDSSVPVTEFTPVKTNLGFVDTTKNSLADLKFSGSYSAASQSNSYLDDVSVSYIDRLQIITAAQKIMQEQVSGPITVQLQDATSSPQTTLANMTLDLKSTSNNGSFSLAASPWVGVSQIVMPKMSQEVTFYYKDTSVGKPLITVAEFPEQGYTDASQEIEVVEKAARFDVEVVSTQVAGTSFKVKLTARDEKGAVNELYNGTLKVSTDYLSPTGGLSSVSPDTVTGFSRGVLEFVATYSDCGLITITVTDDVDNTLVGTSNQIRFLPASFTVSAETPQIVSKTFPLSITAKNAQGTVTPNYNGTVNLYAAAVSPLDISQAQFTPESVAGTSFNNGVATADTFYNLYGTIKIRAEDSLDSTKTGITDEIKFQPKSMAISIKAPAGRDFYYINEPFQLSTLIQDELGAPVTNYSGVVELSSSAGLILPGPYTFSAADLGNKDFIINSNKEGSYTVTARATQDNLSIESAKITVKNATIEVLDNTSPIGTGEVVIQILDDQNNVVTTENDLTITIKAVEEIENGSVSLPSRTVTFKEGKAIIPVTDTEAETVTIEPVSIYKIQIKKGKITFGKPGKTGVNQLLWRELKTKK